MSRASSPIGRNPFQALALDPDADLADADVLAAWRRIAAATHPDRADGGDPERFAAATAAYTDLRTRSGRGEARADLQQAGPLPRSGRLTSRLAGRIAATMRSAAPAMTARLAHGRPAMLALRTCAAAGAATLGILAAGPGPAGPALATGAATWLALTLRRDLAPRPTDVPGAHVRNLE